MILLNIGSVPDWLHWHVTLTIRDSLWALRPMYVAPGPGYQKGVPRNSSPNHKLELKSTLTKQHSRQNKFPLAKTIII